LNKLLDALFLFNVFKNKINPCPIVDAAGFRVRTDEIRDFSAINFSRLSRSLRYVTAANSICRYLEVFKKHTVFPEDIIFFL
jgi:hypothetical protein